jgi:hypothetical protein
MPCSSILGVTSIKRRLPGCDGIQARLVLAAFAVMPAPAMAGLISENVAEQSAKAGRRLRVVCRIGIVLSHPCDQPAAYEGLQV